MGVYGGTIVGMYLRVKRVTILLFVLILVAGLFAVVYGREMEVTSNPVTGYFGSSSQEEVPPTVEPLHLLFIGDVMLDRAVALHAQREGKGSLVGHVAQIFLGMDTTVANLEGTITTNPSVSEVNFDDLRFTFEPDYADYLKQIGISAVSLSNNHTFDFGQDGYRQTKEFLAQVGIVPFGSPHNEEGQLSADITIRGKKVCFVGYEEFIKPDLVPLVDEIKRIRPGCHLLIATMHAGVEYASSYTESQQRAAHAFVDAGADMVVGTHPHVVQPLEIYKGKPIFYSLGNFLFDQDFSFETTHGLAVAVTWGGESTSYTLVPVTIRGGEVSFPGTDDHRTTLRALVDENLPQDIASAILESSSFTLLGSAEGQERPAEQQ